MKTAQIFVNNLINKNIFRFNKGQLIMARWVIFGDNQFMVKHISYTKSFNISVSVVLTTLAHVKWV